MRRSVGRAAWLLGALFGLAGMGTSATALVMDGIAVDLGLSRGSTTAVISLYVLASAVGTVIYGRLCDLFGARLPIVTGVSLMAAGAVVSALSERLDLLLAGRVVQGAGAAALPIVGMVIVGQKALARERAPALARLAGASATVSCCGPLVGGVIGQAAGWRAVVAVPALGIVALPLIWTKVQGRRERLAFDTIGAAAVSTAATGAILTIQTPALGISLWLAALALLVVGVSWVIIHVRRRPDGFLPLSVLRRPEAMRAALVAAVVPGAWFGMLVAVPGILVAGGWERWQVGAALLPAAVVGWASPRAARAISRAWGPVGALQAAAFLACGALLLSLAALGAGSHTLLCVSVASVTGAFGVGHPAMSTIVMTAMPAHLRGVALALATLVFMLGGSAGAAVVGGLAAWHGPAVPLAVLAGCALVGGLTLIRGPAGKIPDAAGEQV